MVGSVQQARACVAHFVQHLCRHAVIRETQVVKLRQRLKNLLANGFPRLLGLVFLRLAHQMQHPTVNSQQPFVHHYPSLDERVLFYGDSPNKLTYHFPSCQHEASGVKKIKLSKVCHRDWSYGNYGARYF